MLLQECLRAIFITQLTYLSSSYGCLPNGLLGCPSNVLVSVCFTNTELQGAEPTAKLLRVLSCPI